ncbi:hypothetical protein [Bradyrhizobium diazoefficiens]
MEFDDQQSERDKLLAEQIQDCERLLSEQGRVKGSRDERIWAAGFFDGEGYVSAFETGITCEIDQIQEDLINLVRFRDAVGVGKIMALKARSNENARPACRWRARSQAEAQTVFDAIGEFLNPAKKNGRRAPKEGVVNPPADGFARALAAPYKAILSRKQPALPAGAFFYEPVAVEEADQA